MKLAAAYTVWNGLELIWGSIEAIQDQVDEIIICWQEHSNKGERSEELLKFVEHLEFTNFHLVEFTPDLNLNTKQNEMAKHNLIINAARDLGCSHFFLSACDHYYEPHEFSDAKFKIEHQNIDVSFTKMYTYYKEPTWRMDPPEDYYMPFICRIYPDTVMARVPGYPVKVDPSIQITPLRRYYKFEQREIMMHHYSMIRKDIENKFRNAAASIRWKPQQIQRYIQEYKTAQPGDEISYFQNRKIIEVSNVFMI